MVAAPGSDGAFDIVATAVGSAGTSTVIRTLTVDTAAPVVAITSAGSTSNSATRTVTGQARPGPPWRCWTAPPCSARRSLPATAPGACPSRSTGEGGHSLTARAADAAGNVATSAPVTYTLDTVAPPVAIATIEGGDTTVNAAEAAGGILVSGTAEIGSSLTVNGAAVTVNGSGAWSTTLTAPADGPFDVTAIATDAAGNTTTVTQTLAVDTVAPTVAITSAGGTVTSAAQTITGTGEAGTTVEVLDGTTLLGTALVAGDGTWSVSVTLAGDGAHSLTARDTDAAGNVGTSDAVEYTLSTTPANTAPTITSNGGGAAAAISIAENGTTGDHDLAATDAEVTSGMQTLTFTISGGENAGLFEIRNGNELHFLSAPNFEALPAAGPTAGYQVNVQVSDGASGIDTQAIAVTVTNTAEPTVGGDTLSHQINGSGNNQTVALRGAAITDGDLVTVANPSGTASPTYQWQFSSNGGINVEQHRRRNRRDLHAHGRQRRSPGACGRHLYRRLRCANGDVARRRDRQQQQQHPAGHSGGGPADRPQRQRHLYRQQCRRSGHRGDQWRQQRCRADLACDLHACRQCREPDLQRRQHDGKLQLDGQQPGQHDHGRRGQRLWGGGHPPAGGRSRRRCWNDTLNGAGATIR